VKVGSYVRSTAASFDATPPPPPVTGFGDGLFSASGGDLALAADVGPCFVSTPTHYAYVYTTDASTKPFGINQVAHIKFDELLSHQITIHQAPNEGAIVDAEGMIVGPDFSFRIATSESGQLSPFDFVVAVTGVLTTPSRSCDASGHFSGSLSPQPGDSTSSTPVRRYHAPFTSSARSSTPSTLAHRRRMRFTVFKPSMFRLVAG